MRHRVAFYETDAMGVVHHSNYVRFLETARVAWLDEHDRPYREYVDQGLQFAVTRVELDFHKPARFDDVVEVAVWLAWVRGASLGMAYALTCGGALVAAGLTEHAAVNAEGRVRRLPPERRAHLRSLAPG